MNATAARSKKADSKTDPVRTFRMLLAANGLTYRDIEARSGMARRTIHNITCGQNQYDRGRKLIEDVLGIEIWRKQDPRAATPRRSPLRKAHA